MSPIKVVAVMGPTAAGKTSLAIDLSGRHPFEIISVDSAQIYRGMDIGTAKPDEDTRRLHPHRLIDIREPDERYSAAEFRADALAEIAAIAELGRHPLLVGGTMLYFKALFEGLSPLPKADPEVRRQLADEAAVRGWDALHRDLRAIDPDSAQRIDPSDPQRIQRALEVHRLTGQPLSKLQQRRGGSDYDFPTLKIIVCPGHRAHLHDRIARRTDAMFAAGLVDEVRRLRASGIPADTPAMRSVGYRQVRAALEEDSPGEAARQRVLAATRQLAKRQLTWLRRETGALWVDPEKQSELEAVHAAVDTFLKS